MIIYPLAVDLFSRIISLTCLYFIETNGDEHTGQTQKIHVFGRVIEMLNKENAYQIQAGK